MIPPFSEKEKIKIPIYSVFQSSGRAMVITPSMANTCLRILLHTGWNANITMPETQGQYLDLGTHYNNICLLLSRHSRSEIHRRNISHRLSWRVQYNGSPLSASFHGSITTTISFSTISSFITKRTDRAGSRCW